jgi:AcrR family transcriptional regulator
MAKEVAGLRERLIDQALRMLDEGAGEISLRGVAVAAGVSAMAPYRHFADKSALMAAVAERGFALLRDRVLAADRQTDPEAALVAQGLAYIAFAQAHPALFRLMFAGHGPAQPDAIEKRESGDTAYTVLSTRMGTIVRDPADVPAATLAAWGIVHGLAVLVLDGRLSPQASDARSALGLLVRGCQAP